MCLRNEDLNIKRTRDELGASSVPCALHRRVNVGAVVRGSRYLRAPLGCGKLTTNSYGSLTCIDGTLRVDPGVNCIP